MNTVGEAIEMLNEKQLHPNGFHLFFVRDELIDDNGGDNDPSFNLMKQTYDWRYGEAPKKERYTVTLSADDMVYIGKAMEVYHEAIVTRYLKPALKRLMQSMENIGKERSDELETDIQPE